MIQATDGWDGLTHDVVFLSPEVARCGWIVDSGAVLARQRKVTCPECIARAETFSRKKVDTR